jgi:hypothetical protein
MFAAVDVCYDEGQSTARAACVLFPDPLGEVITEDQLARGKDPPNG